MTVTNPTGEASGFAHLTIRRGGRAGVLAAREALMLTRVRCEMKFEHAADAWQKADAARDDAATRRHEAQIELARIDVAMAAYDAALASSEPPALPAEQTA